MSTIENTGNFATTYDNERYEFAASCTVESQQNIRDLIHVAKTSDKEKYDIGEVATYTYTITIGDVVLPLQFQSFADSLATGLQFVVGSVTVNGVAMPDLEVYYFETEFEANTTNVITYQCLVTA